MIQATAVEKVSISQWKCALVLSVSSIGSFQSRWSKNKLYTRKLNDCLDMLFGGIQEYITYLDIYVLNKEA